MDIIEIHEIAQKLVDQMEKEIGTIQTRIEGVALLYKELAEEYVRREQQRDLSSVTAQEEESASTAIQQTTGTASG